jgi:hypothetical protein
LVRLNALVIEFFAQYNSYNIVNKEIFAKRSHYINRALRSTIAALIHNHDVPEEELVIYRGYYDLDSIKLLKSYSWSSMFAVLKYCSRKLKSLQKEHSKNKKTVVGYLDRVKELDRAMTEVGMNETHPEQYDRVIAFRDLILSVRNENTFESGMLFPSLTIPFVGGWRIKKDVLIQLISINKGRKYWDGVKVEPFSERCAELPEEMDFDAFKKAIFISKIEHEDDCFLFDLFMENMLETMDAYKKEHGKPMIDAFKLLEDISGKPLQTFTAHTDEYGDVVSMEPNKPNLKLVEAQG